MNLFEIVLIDAVFILFPLIIYNLFLASSKNITEQCKKLFFSFALISSFFLIYKYSNYDTTINLLIINSLILIGYLKKQYLIANTIVIMTFLIYFFDYNYLFFMIIPYLFLIVLNIFKKKKSFSDFLFIDLFLLVHYFVFLTWIKLFNEHILFQYHVMDLFGVMIFNYLMIHIIYFLYNEGEKIINYHTNYKELKREKEIRLSLFKITHEIKNPIAVIKAYLDMLDMDNNKQVHKYIPIIKSEIDRLLNLLQDFMLINKNSIEKDIMDINMLIEEVLDTLNPLLKKQDIKLKVDLIDDDILIDGDYKRLSQVLINIIKNSIEAMDKKRKTIKIKNSIKYNQLNIIIEDNGSGINTNSLKKIKTPFYTTKKRGTGLGVSLSDEIIKAHSGVLIYESVVGKGTKVTIKLPLKREDDIDV